MTDEEWAFVAPYLTLMREDAPQREHSLREVFDALRYVVRAGEAWRMMPNDLPPWDIVYQQTRRWMKAGVFEAMTHDLRELLRMLAGRDPKPSAQPVCTQTGFRSSGSTIVYLTGAVSNGDSFTQELTPGLVFRLDPSPGSEKRGWTIRVVPRSRDKDELTDYVWVVTPPYHFRNPRYLDTTYGVSAEEAVAWSPREFFFVLSDADYRRATAAVEQVWSGNDDQLQEAKKVLADIPKGRGWLCINDFVLSRSTGQAPRSIERLSFEVVIEFPAEKGPLHPREPDTKMNCEKRAKQAEQSARKIRIEELAQACTGTMRP